MDEIRLFTQENHFSIDELLRIETGISFVENCNISRSLSSEENPICCRTNSTIWKHMHVLKISDHESSFMTNSKSKNNLE